MTGGGRLSKILEGSYGDQTDGWYCVGLGFYLAEGEGSVGHGHN